MLCRNASSEWQVDINNHLDRTCALKGAVNTWLSEQENIGNVCPLEQTAPETVFYLLLWPPPGSAITGVSCCPSPSLASAFKGLTCPWRNCGKAEAKSEKRMQVMSVLGKPEGSLFTAD